MFARFDENPALTLQDIKETKCYGRTHGRTHTRTDKVKAVYPPQTKFAGGGGGGGGGGGFGGITNKVCVRYNKLGIVHCPFHGVLGYNLKKYIL